MNECVDSIHTYLMSCFGTLLAPQAAAGVHSLGPRTAAYLDTPAACVFPLVLCLFPPNPLGPVGEHQGLEVLSVLYQSTGEPVVVCHSAEEPAATSQVPEEPSVFLWDPENSLAGWYRRYALVRIVSLWPNNLGFDLFHYLWIEGKDASDS